MTTSRFARRIVGTSLRSAGTIAALLILSVLVGLGLFLPCNPDPGVGTTLSKKSYESNLESFQGLLDSDFARALPSEDIDLTKREVAALERAVAASSTSEFINAATEFFNLEIESAEHGYLITDVRALSAQRDYLLLFAEMEHPTLGYASTLEAPALYYASAMIWTIPYLAFYLPVLAAVIAAALYRRKGRLLSRAPVSPACGFLVSAATGTAAAVATVVIAFMPSMLVCTIRNGFGDPAYPMMFEVGDTMRTTTLGASLAESALLFVALSIVLAVIAEFFFMISSSALLAGISAVVALALPTLPFYSAVAMSPLGAYLPTTYLQVWSITGFASFAPEFSACPIPGVSLPAALISSIVLAVVLIGAGIALRACIDKPKGGQHA